MSRNGSSSATHLSQLTICPVSGCPLQSSYHTLTPTRITDTRAGSGFPNAGKTLGPGATLNIQVTRAGEVPSTAVSAVVLNVTATNPTKQSFVDVVVDVGGYFTDASSPLATGGQFTAMTPVRIKDTRTSHDTLGPSSSLTVPVAGVHGIPKGSTAAVMNVTVTDTTASSFLTVWPTGVTKPLASDLNWVAGKTVPNLVVATLGSSDGAVQVFNAAGSTDVVVDVSGYYT